MQLRSAFDQYHQVHQERYGISVRRNVKRDAEIPGLKKEEPRQPLELNRIAPSKIRIRTRRRARTASLRLQRAGRSRSGAESRMRMALCRGHLERPACALTPTADRSRHPHPPEFDAIDVAHWIQDQIKKASSLPPCLSASRTP